MPKKERLDLDGLLVKIIELLARHDDQELTFSRVSKLCEVPRSTLYYYFGNSTETMLAEAARYCLKNFFGVFENEPVQAGMDWDKYQDVIFRNSVEIVCRFPWVPRLYFHWLNRPGKVGDAVREFQVSYFDSFRRRWKEVHGTLPEMLPVKILASMKMGVLFGIASEDEIRANREGVIEIVKMLSRNMLGTKPTKA